MGFLVSAETGCVRRKKKISKQFRLLFRDLGSRPGKGHERRLILLWF